MKAEYNIDNGSVEVIFLDGSKMSILCNVIEDAMDLTMMQRSEYDRLAYDHPIEFARLVLSGELESYLKGHAKDYASQKESIKVYLVNNGYENKEADTIANEFMNYNS